MTSPRTQILTVTQWAAPMAGPQTLMALLVKPPLYTVHTLSIQTPALQTRLNFQVRVCQIQPASNSMSSLGYEISHIPRFPEYFGPAPIEDLAPNKPPQKHKNRKQRLPVVEKQLEDLQTKTEGAGHAVCSF